MRKFLARCTERAKMVALTAILRSQPALTNYEEGFAMAKPVQSFPGGTGQDLTGKTFGKLAVLNFARTVTGGKIIDRWKCRCACGHTRLISTENIERSIARPCKWCSDGYDEIEIGLLNEAFKSSPDKKCPVCRELLPIAQFPTFTTKSGRVKSKMRCTTCNSSSEKSYYAKLKIENPEEYKSILDGRRIRSRYGITPEQREEMRIRQNFRCAICGKDRPLHIDHCHSTNRVRGLLCGTCNRGIGMLNDDPEILAKAIVYINETKTRSPEPLVRSLPEPLPFESPTLRQIAEP